MEKRNIVQLKPNMRCTECLKCNWNLAGSHLSILCFFNFFYHQGTEVKAITYSNMQVHDNDDKHEVYVIIDI